MPAINFGIYNASIIPTLCTRHKVREWGNNSYYDLHDLSQSHVNRIAFPHFLLFSVHKVKQEHVCGHVILQGDFQRVEGLGNLPRYPAERDPVFFRDLLMCHKSEPAVGKDLPSELRHLSEFASDDFFHIA